MKALENRALDSKREMEELNALDEIKSVNNRYSNISTDQVIAALRRSSGRPLSLCSRGAVSSAGRRDWSPLRGGRADAEAGRGAAPAARWASLEQSPGRLLRTHERILFYT